MHGYKPVEIRWRGWVGVIDGTGARVETREGVWVAHNGLSAECRANRHQDCVDGGCVCACHGAEDE